MADTLALDLDISADVLPVPYVCTVTTAASRFLLLSVHDKIPTAFKSRRLRALKWLTKVFDDFKISWKRLRCRHVKRLKLCCGRLLTRRGDES